MISTKQTTVLSLATLLGLAVATQAVAAQSSADLGSLVEQAGKAVEDAKTTEIQAEEAKNTGVVNINTADVETLAQLPGVDEKLAKAITEYREVNGSFLSIEDLAKITGVDASLVEKIAPLVQI